jgi:hypothetical protein
MWERRGITRRALQAAEIVASGEGDRERSTVRRARFGAGGELKEAGSTSISSRCFFILSRGPPLVAAAAGTTAVAVGLSDERLANVGGDMGQAAVASVHKLLASPLERLFLPPDLPAGVSSSSSDWSSISASSSSSSSSSSSVCTFSLCSACRFVLLSTFFDGEQTDSLVAESPAASSFCYCCCWCWCWC